MRKWLAALILAMGVLVIPTPSEAAPDSVGSSDSVEAVEAVESPDVPAHNSGNIYANWACGGTRPSTHYTVVIHTHPEAFVGNPPSLLVVCQMEYPAICRGASWTAYLLPDGTPFGPLNGYHYYDC